MRDLFFGGGGGEVWKGVVLHWLLGWCSDLAVCESRARWGVSAPLGDDETEGLL